MIWGRRAGRAPFAHTWGRAPGAELQRPQRRLGLGWGGSPTPPAPLALQLDPLPKLQDPLGPAPPPRAAGGCGRGLGAAAAPPPSFRLPLLRRSVVASFLLSHASRYGAERPDRQLHLKIPEAVPAMEEDQELER